MTMEELRAKVPVVCDEALNKGNLDALGEINWPDVVWHMPPAPDVNGLEPYKQAMAKLRAALSGFHYTVESLIIEGNMSAMKWRMQGTHTGQLPSTPIPPTGREVTLEGVMLSRMLDGKAVEHWIYQDWLGFMQQLGVMPGGSGT